MKRSSTLTLFRRATIREITRTSINRIEQRNSNANSTPQISHAINACSYFIGICG